MLGILLLAFCASAIAIPQDQLNHDQRLRYQALIEQLRCVVCMNTNIAQSEAPLAADMRDIVARQILAGRSNTQVKRYLASRYGQFILYKPRFEPATWLLWLGPAVLLLIGLVVAWLIWRR